MKIEELPVSVLQMYERNPRKNDAAVKGVAESIKQFGWQQPIVVDRNCVIIAGHTRYKAALELGLKHVPVVRAEQLTDEQVRAYRILDNKLNELSSWDFAKLENELTTFDFNLEPFGMTLNTYELEDVFEGVDDGEGNDAGQSSAATANGSADVDVDVEELGEMETTTLEGLLDEANYSSDVEAEEERTGKLTLTIFFDEAERDQVAAVFGLKSIDKVVFDFEELHKT